MLSAQPLQFSASDVPPVGHSPSIISFPSGELELNSEVWDAGKFLSALKLVYTESGEIRFDVVIPSSTAVGSPLGTILPRSEAERSQSQLDRQSIPQGGELEAVDLGFESPTEEINGVPEIGSSQVELLSIRTALDSEFVYSKAKGLPEEPQISFDGSAAVSTPIVHEPTRVRAGVMDGQWAVEKATIPPSGTGHDLSTIPQSPSFESILSRTLPREMVIASDVIRLPGDESFSPGSQGAAAPPCGPETGGEAYLPFELDIIDKALDCDQEASDAPGEWWVGPMTRPRSIAALAVALVVARQAWVHAGPAFSSKPQNAASKAQVERGVGH